MHAFFRFREPPENAAKFGTARKCKCSAAVRIVLLWVLENWDGFRHRQFSAPHAVRFFGSSVFFWGYFCVLSIPQVMPHLSKKASPDGGHALFRHKFWWQIELARLLRSHQSPSEKQAHKQTVQRLRQQRVKSFNLLLSLDHSLQFICSGLVRFTTGLRQVPAPLKPHQKRYEVPWVGPVDAGCPAEIQAAARKFVIEDTITKDRWYELQVFPGGGSGHPCLAIVTDEGPDNMAASFFAMSGMGMRVTWTFDVLHRIMNDLKLALQASDLWPLLQELLHVLNLNHAPWQSKAFFK